MKDLTLRATAEEAEAISTSLRTLLSESSTDGSTAGVPDHDLVIWGRLCEEMSVAALAVPERLGGHGLGLREQVLIAEELGRSGVRTPFVWSVLGATELLLRCVREELALEWLPRLMSGSVVGTVVVPRPGSIARSSDAPTVTASSSGSATVSGTFRNVPFAHQASFTLALIDVDGGQDWVLIDHGDAGVTRSSVQLLDTALPAADLTVEAVVCRRLGAMVPGGAGDASEWISVARLGLAAEQFAAAGGVIGRTASYVSTREQFGRPVGSFQALKHMLADAFVEVEIGRIGLLAAVRDLETDAHGVADSSVIILAQALESLKRSCETSLQLHGAIGFTWEYPLHWVMKRALTDVALAGSPTDLRTMVFLPHGGGS